MSDIIRLLPDSVANQIAAGEVIQRPASVVKELVENAVDAGATSIKIIIKDAGRTLIQVVDNGCGMSETDARLAFERHATSKISDAADLFALHTMGFRGEALASIAAVAQVDLRSMQAGSTIGTRILINGSKVESQQPEACAPGSNMMVKNLFFNVPARRKFLKKDSVELSNILREFERLALVNPEVEFTFIHNETIQHQLMPGSLKQRVAQLFGKSIDKQLIPVDTDTSIVRINGFVSLPEHARKRNQLQFLFVNGRNMRHPYFHKAIMHCYEELIPSDEQPNYFLNFTVDPESIDVNIHPTKNEIKFENEAAIWQIIIAAVKESLGRFNATPGLDFNTDDAPDIPAFEPRPDADHDLQINTSYNPFATTTTQPMRSKIPDTINSRDWEKLFDEFTKRRDESTGQIQGSAINSISSSLNFSDQDEPESSAFPTASMADSSTRNFFQLKNKYIVASAKAGLMIIDQHKAHMRILYDRYLDLARLNAFGTQSVMFPEVLRLSPSQNSILNDILGEIVRMGFDLSYLGDNSWSVNGVPSVIGEVNPNDIIEQIVENASNDISEPENPIVQRIALSMAKAAAIKPGQSLADEEIDHLLSDLFKLTVPNYTPDGHPILTTIDMEQIIGLLE